MATVSKESAENLAKYVLRLVENNRLTGEIKNRFEIIDRGISRETDKAIRKLEEAQRRAEGTDGIVDIELPLAFVQYDSALAYLASVFATGVPMFRSVSSVELETAASMLNSLISRDQARYSWTGNLIKILASGLRYNLYAAEIPWKTKYGISVNTNIQDGSSTTSEATSVLYSGNAYKHLDIYNTFFDSTVAPSEVHEEGAFAGYIERYNYIRFKRFVAQLDRTYLVPHNRSTMFKTGEGLTNFYYTPTIRTSDKSTSPTGGTDWMDFFGIGSFNKTGGTGAFELITCYARIIPVEFDMKVPKQGTPQVWKLIIANSKLIYAEPIIAGHDYLPMVVGQLYDEGFGMQTKSFVENVLPLQNLGTGIVKGTLAAMRRNAVDRGLYNPAMINPKDINSKSPMAKIPVKMNRFNQNFSNAYQPLDFRDSVTPQFNANLGLVLELTNQVNGVNQATQGNFVKGNKTLFEFDTTMTNANARLQLMAMHFENAHMYPVKQIMKINYLLYSTNEILFDPDGQQIVNIDPVELRKRSPEFRMADGLIPATKIGNTEIIMTAFSIMGQIPDLAIEYKLGDMVVSALRQQGMDELDKYKRSEEEKAQYIQQQMAMQQAQQTQGQPQ